VSHRNPDDEVRPTNAEAISRKCLEQWAIAQSVTARNEGLVTSLAMEKSAAPKRFDAEEIFLSTLF
jgi:hypothetical protein